jgi:Protein of unknown function (DUF2809)
MKIHHKKFLLISVLLFITEVLIAFFVNDKIIRPFFGDYLAVMFLFYLLASFFKSSKLKIALFVLFISFFLEGLQYIQFLKIIGCEKVTFIKILLGNTFEWLDLLVYTLGIITIILIHKLYKK